MSIRAMECRHAQFRRYLFSTGVQTLAWELVDLSAVLFLDRTSKCSKCLGGHGQQRFFQPWVCQSHMLQSPSQTEGKCLEVVCTATGVEEELLANRMSQERPRKLEPDGEPS